MESIMQFLNTYKGHRLLYLGHYGADGDAMGSAVALSRVFPGDIGVVHHIRKFGKDLVEKLNVPYLIDPDFSVYDAVVLLDMSSKELANYHIPPLYGVIDHHYSPEDNDLVPDACCYYIRRASSTCELVYDLLNSADLPITRDIAYPLIWGICGDTGIRFGWCHSLNTMEKLVELMRVTKTIPSSFSTFSEPIRDSRFRRSVLKTVKEMDLMEVGKWLIVSAIAADEDVALEAYVTLRDLGAHVSVIGFTCHDSVVVRSAADTEVLKKTNLDLRQIRSNLQSRYGGSVFGGPGSGAINLPKNGAAPETILKAFKEEVITAVSS